jgi:hypothetical protein
MQVAKKTKKNRAQPSVRQYNEIESVTMSKTLLKVCAVLQNRLQEVSIALPLSLPSLFTELYGPFQQ